MRRLFIGLYMLLILSAALLGNSLHAQNKFYDGWLLVANPNMSDLRFSEAVVFICRHDSNGAFGLVLNRPAGQIALSKLMESMDVDSAGKKGDIQIRLGGPVKSEFGFLMYPEKLDEEEQICRSRGVAITSSKDVIKSLGSEYGPDEAVLFFGYAGWGPGQLEIELSHKAWSTIPADRELLFDRNLKDLWTRARTRRGIDL